MWILNLPIQNWYKYKPSALSILHPIYIQLHVLLYYMYKKKKENECFSRFIFIIVVLCYYYYIAHE